MSAHARSHARKRSRCSLVLPLARLPIVYGEGVIQVRAHNDFQCHTQVEAGVGR